MQDGHLQAKVLCGRRDVLRAALAVTPLLITPARAVDATPTQEDATALHPQVGDRLVFLSGPKEGSPIRVDDLPLGGPQEQAYPASPDGVVRDGSRLNLVIVARVGEDGLSEETRKLAADGVVAYSGVCTHQGCPVNMWSEDRKAFVCSCHGSIYNPKDDAEVLFGPAPRHLPPLPLKAENGLLLVAGGFIGRVGGTQG